MAVCKGPCLRVAIPPDPSHLGFRGGIALEDSQEAVPGTKLVFSAFTLRETNPSLIPF